MQWTNPSRSATKTHGTARTDVRLTRIPRCSTSYHTNSWSSRRYLATSPSLICPRYPGLPSPPSASLTLPRRESPLCILTSAGTSPSAAIARSATARSGACSLCGSPPLNVKGALPALPGAGAVPACPGHARLAFALVDCGPVDPDVVGTVRVMGSGSGCSRTDAVSTRVDCLTATGAPALNAAQLSWNDGVNISPSLTPSSSGVCAAAVFRQACGTLSTMAPGSEGASDGRGFAKRGLAVFIVTPTLFSRAPPGSTTPSFNGPWSFSRTPPKTGPCGPS